MKFRLKIICQSMLRIISSIKTPNILRHEIKIHDIPLYNIKFLQKVQNALLVYTVIHKDRNNK